MKETDEGRERKKEEEKRKKEKMVIWDKSYVNEAKFSSSRGKEMNERTRKEQERRKNKQEERTSKNKEQEGRKKEKRNGYTTNKHLSCCPISLIWIILLLFLPNLERKEKKELEGKKEREEAKK